MLSLSTRGRSLSSSFSFRNRLSITASTANGGGGGGGGRSTDRRQRGKGGGGGAKRGIPIQERERQNGRKDVFGCIVSEREEEKAFLLSSTGVQHFFLIRGPGEKMFIVCQCKKNRAADTSSIVIGAAKKMLFVDHPGKVRKKERERQTAISHRSSLLFYSW